MQAPGRISPTTTTAATLIGAGLLLGSKLFSRRRSYHLRNKVVVITGGSRGLGLSLARQFLREGAAVALLGRDDESLTQAKKRLSSEDHSQVLTVTCDVTSQDQVKAAIQQVRRTLGPIDVLVNNAGLISVGPMDSMTEEDYRNSLALHFWAPFFTCAAVLPEMRKRKQGRIVNISSIGGKISVPHLLPYSVGKFALAGFSEGLRTEVARDNVCVTSVYPGLMRTGSPRNATFKGKHRAEYAWFSLSDSLPAVSMSADRAARQIVDACRRGTAHVILSLPAKAAIALHQHFPNTSAAVLSAANRLLPAAGGIGTRGKKGKDSASSLSPSWLTILDQLAARRNNEVRV